MLYLHCERCHEQRLFLAVEERPPIDPNMACCSSCGFSFGYRQVEDFVSGRLVMKTRPTLAVSTIVAGREEFVRRKTEGLLLSGSIPEAEDARIKFAATEGDREGRRALTTEARPGLDPGLAARILAPRMPGNQDGE